MDGDRADQSGAESVTRRQFTRIGLRQTYKFLALLSVDITLYTGDTARIERRASHGAFCCYLDGCGLVAGGGDALCKVWRRRLTSGWEMTAGPPSG